MKKNVLFFILGATYFGATAQNADALKQTAFGNIDAKYTDLKKHALQIWDYAEMGYKETKSSQLHQDLLRQNGFKVESGVADIPTAFVGTFGEGKPVIGILAEYDALPGLSQSAKPEKEPRKGVAAGHGCGHHLFGTASVAAAIELKNTMVKNKIKGTIKIYGTPAEEGGGGKVYMVRAGLFEGVDVMIHWHPDSRNGASASSSLANMSAKFRFYGQAAHAAGAPERGRSALDAVEAMNMMANMMREHIPQDARMHYVITDGGKAPNVVPEYAEVYYYVRHPRPDVTKEIFDRLVKCAEGAALGTETRMDYELINAVYNILPINTLAYQMHANLTKIGGVKYSADELAFGAKIQESFPAKSRPPLTEAAGIEPFTEGGKGGGSTDVGDVSWVVPTVGFRAATWVPGTPAHSWQAVACGGTEIGTKGMIVAAKGLTAMGIDCLLDANLVKKATDEWTKLRAGFQYKPLVGNRKPPLTYRDASAGATE